MPPLYQYSSGFSAVIDEGFHIIVTVWNENLASDWKLNQVNDWLIITIKFDNKEKMLALYKSTYASFDLPVVDRFI